MAALVQRSEYHAFASFTFAATTYYIGTQDELRGGNWYEGVIKTGPQLAMAFNADPGVVQAANVDLVIASNATGTYRTLAVGNILDGTSVTVSLVMRQYLSDGTTAEQVYTQILTIVGTTLNPGTVTLRLQDIEEQRLQALYPPNTWQSTDWPELSSDDAGKPICEPVGTAIKLPAVLLRSDSANNEYWYGVCTGTPKLIGISSVSSGTKTITLSSAPLYALALGQVLIVTGSSAADGSYTIASIGSPTTIVVNETLPAATGGSIRLMPQVLTVYRNKRVVSASEYTVQQSQVPGAIANGNFASGLTNWLQLWYTTAGGYVNTNPGAGSTISATGGVCTITSVSNTNFAFLRCAPGLMPGWGGVKYAYYAVQLTVSAGSGDIAINDIFRAPESIRRLPAKRARSSRTVQADRFRYSTSACATTSARSSSRTCAFFRFRSLCSNSPNHRSTSTAATTPSNAIALVSNRKTPVRKSSDCSPMLVRRRMRRRSTLRKPQSHIRTSTAIMVAVDNAGSMQSSPI